MPCLRATDLVAAQDHRHALGKQQRGQEVALLTLAQGQHRRVVCRAFGAAVPGSIVRLAVAVVVAVGLVVLVVVADEVSEREAVVGGDEVDAGVGFAAGRLVQVRAAGQPIAEFAERSGLASPEVAHGVAVLPVPLRPERREVAHLVAALADVPGLGDELDLADDRILLDEVEERREAVDVLQLARQRGGQVEPETVDVHLLHPVPEAVHDQLQHVGVAGVEGVARAGVVHVIAFVALDQPVVGGVVEAAERERRSEVVALRGVVVDDVEDHLDAGLVQRPNHRLELGHLAAGLPRRGVLVVRREEADRVVAPVVAEPSIEEVAVLHELVDGHQLDGGDPELAQVADGAGWARPAYVPRSSGGTSGWRSVKPLTWSS